MNINALRREYKHPALNRQSVNKNPVRQFETWLDEAVKSEIPEPTAMTISTVNKKGMPQSRIVLLKFFDEDGFIFFTNYQSQKGKSLENNTATSLLFFWPELERQVRIEGYAVKTNKELSTLVRILFCIRIFIVHNTTLLTFLIF
jgi:pyridoxamine 5'-phosphate oxidase